MNEDSFSESYIIDDIYISKNDIYEKGSIINDQYRIESILPGGSMGRVFKCYDFTINREVVVKSIDADPFILPESQNTLVKEIMNWMKLPLCSNLVNITGVFYDTSGQSLFFVMPYIYGHSKYGLELENWMETYQFTELDMLYTGIAVCNALKECLEQTGRVPVHGDIKPSNILLEYKGERFKNQPLLSCNILLADCGAIGYTEKYFPEEYKNQKLSPDCASDVYALVTVLHEMEEHVVKEYDSKNSIVHSIYELLIEREQWKRYNLVQVLDDLLLPGFQKKFEIDPKELLYKYVRARPFDIFYRVQNIHSKLQMIRKDDSLLEEIDILWGESEKQNYMINEIPLTCYIDRHYFVCAHLCAKFELAEKILCRYEEALSALPEERQNVFGKIYSLDLKDDFKILHGQFKAGIGQNSAAQLLFHGVKLEKCICYKWLENYVEICLASAMKGQTEEGRYLQKQLQKYISVHGQEIGKRALAELTMYLGRITMNLGEVSASVPIFEKCVDRYPDDLEFLYNYGQALMFDGQISKARYPLHLLYYHCQAIRKRHNDESGRPLYPAQTIAMYSSMAAYMTADFPVAIKNVDEFEKQFLFYHGYKSDQTALIKQMMQDGYDIYCELYKTRSQMSMVDICNNFIMYCMNWKKYLSSPWGHMSYLYRRGELQVLMDLHTWFADFMLASRKYDELVESCKYMLSILKDSGTVKLYLARAYAMKGESKLAARFYRESADMIKYEYPKLDRYGKEPEAARMERIRIQKEMKMLGLV